MRLYFLPAAILGLFLVGCTPDLASEAARDLAGNTQKDWAEVMNHGARSHYGVRFRADGTFQRYVHNSKEVRTCYGEYDGHRWHLLPNGTLEMGGRTYVVAYRSADVLVLRNKMGPGVLTYLKDQDQQTQCHPDTSGSALRM